MVVTSPALRLVCPAAKASKAAPCDTRVGGIVAAGTLVRGAWEPVWPHIAR